MKHVRVCIVGAGPMGRLHAQKIAGIGAAGDPSEVTAIVDHHAVRAGEVAAISGAEVMEDLDAAFGRSDVAVIAVPTINHYSITERALAAGLDVLVEKPLASEIKDAESLIASASARGRILQVGHVEWYNAAWRKAAAHAGTPQRIGVDRMNPPSNRGLDLDVVQDLMLHDLDWVTRFVGEEVVQLSAEGACTNSPRLDVAAVQLEFASGCIATLRASRVHTERRRRVQIVGDASSQTADLLQPMNQPQEASPAADPLEQQWTAFLTAVRTRSAPENSGEVGLAALRWVERVRAEIAGGPDGAVG